MAVSHPGMDRRQNCRGCAFCSFFGGCRQQGCRQPQPTVGVSEAATCSQTETTRGGLGIPIIIPKSTLYHLGLYHVGLDPCNPYAYPNGLQGCVAVGANKGAFEVSIVPAAKRCRRVALGVYNHGERGVGRVSYDRAATRVWIRSRVSA